MAKGMLIGEGISTDTRPAREATGDLSAGWGVSGGVSCQSCHYTNPVSHAFYVLSVQNLYCRKCGRMIDRHGKVVVPS